MSLLFLFGQRFKGGDGEFHLVSILIVVVFWFTLGHYAV